MKKLIQWVGIGLAVCGILRGEEDAAKVTEAYVRAEAALDYERIAELTDARSLSTFRTVFERVMARSALTYGADAVAGVLDSPDGLDSLEAKDDRAFLEHVMECLTLPIQMEECGRLEVVSIQPSEGRIYVHFRLDRKLQTVSHRRLYGNCMMELVEREGELRVRGTPIRFAETQLERLCRGWAMTRSVMIVP